MILIAIVWGYAFIPQRIAMESMGPHTFNAIRFCLGILATLPFCLSSRNKLSDYELRVGLFLGVLLFLGAAAQQIGMQYTTAGKGGFITSLYIIGVPFISRIWFREQISHLAWIGASISVAGLYLLMMHEALHIELGDLWVLLCALIFSVHVVTVGRCADKVDPLRLALLQYMVTVLLSLPCALLFETIVIEPIMAAWPTYMYAGIISIGFGYSAQLFTQRHISATEAGLIFGLESLFAALFGAFFLQESLSQIQIFGCFLMLMGCSLAQMKVLWPGQRTHSAN